jgi:hypothetical protein
MNADIELIRKVASVENGRRYFADRFGSVEHDAVALLRIKQAAAADQGLLKIAAWCSKNDTLNVYEALGGGSFNSV